MRKRTLFSMMLLGFLLLEAVLLPANLASARELLRTEYILPVKVLESDATSVSDATVYLYGCIADEQGLYPILWTGKTNRHGLANVVVPNDGVTVQQYQLKIAKPGRFPVLHDFTVNADKGKTLAKNGFQQLEFMMERTSLADTISTYQNTTQGIGPNYMVDIRQVSREDLGWQKIRLAYMHNAELEANTTLSFEYKTQLDFSVNVGISFIKKDQGSISNPKWEAGASLNYQHRTTDGTVRSWRVQPGEAPKWACTIGRIEGSHWQQLVYMPVNDDYWGWVLTDEWFEAKPLDVSTNTTEWDSNVESHVWTKTPDFCRPGTTTGAFSETYKSAAFGVKFKYKGFDSNLNVTVHNSQKTTTLTLDNDRGGTKTVNFYKTSDHGWHRFSTK